MAFDGANETVDTSGRRGPVAGGPSPRGKKRFAVLKREPFRRGKNDDQRRPALCLIRTPERLSERLEDARPSSRPSIVRGVGSTVPGKLQKPFGHSNASLAGKRGEQSSLVKRSGVEKATRTLKKSTCRHGKPDPMVGNTAASAQGTASPPGSAPSRAGKVRPWAGRSDVVWARA